MPDVFLSYSRRDQTFVRTLADSLAADGRDVWVDWEDIPLTSEWFQEIQAGIEASDAFVFVISPDSVQSEICRAEVDHAVAHGKRFIPIVFRDLTSDEDQAALHPKVSTHQWLFFRESDSYENAFATLTKALDLDLAHTRTHTRLLQRAIEWEGQDRDSSFLLRGTDLTEAEAWRDSALQQDKQPGVTDLQEEYIHASRQAENWRLRERILSVVISVLGVLLAVALVVALSQYLRAENERRVVQQLSLAANSRVALNNNDTDLAIALAVQAANPSGGPLAVNELERVRPETERALADAAYNPGTRFVFTGHDADVLSVAFHPQDDTLALSTDAAGRVLLWDAASGDILWALDDAHDGAAVYSVAFNSDGTQIVTGGGDGVVRVWDAASGEPVTTVSIGEPVRSVSFGFGDRVIMAGGEDGRVFQWNPVFDERETLADFDTPVTEVALVGGTRALVMPIFEPVMVWSLQSGDVIELLPLLDVSETETNVLSNYAGAVAVLPGGDTILGSYGLTIRVISTGSPNQVRVEYSEHSGYVNSIAVNSGGVAVSSDIRETSVHVWDITTGQQIRLLRGHTESINDVAVSAGGRYALTGSDDDTVRVWDLANGAEVTVTPAHSNQLYGVAYSPDGHYLAAGARDNRLLLWDISDPAAPERVWQSDPVHTDSVWIAVFSPDGQQLLSASEDGTIAFWDTADGAIIGESLDASTTDEIVTTVAFSPDGAYALSGGNDGIIRRWDVATQTLASCYGPLEGCLWDETSAPAGRSGPSRDGYGALRSVAFSADGTQILAGSSQTLSGERAGYAYLIDVETGAVVQTFAGHNDRVNSVAFHPTDPTLIVTGSADATICLWNVATGEEQRVYEGHTGQVRAVAFSPGGDRMISASGDGTLLLWDVESGLAVRRFDGHTEWVSGAAFAPDGRYVASSSWDGTLRLWHVHSVDQLIDWVEDNRFDRALTPGEYAIYVVGGGPPAAAEAISANTPESAP